MTPSRSPAYSIADQFDAFGEPGPCIDSVAQDRAMTNPYDDHTAPTFDRVPKRLADPATLLRAVLDAEWACVKVIGPDGSLLDMNPAGLRMIKADSLEQVVNRSLDPLIADEHWAAFTELRERVFLGESGTLEFEIVGLKGDRSWVETHATPLRDRKGAVIALVGITRDISARRETEVALRMREERLMTVFRNCPVAITVHRWSDRKFVDVNAAFANLLGWTRDDVVGRTAEEVQLVDPAAAARLRSLLVTHQALRNVDLAIKTRAGETRHVLLGTELVDLYGERHAVTTFVDVTERTLSEESRRATDVRYLRQRDALIALTSGKVDYASGLASVLGNIAERAAQTLGVARVGIWRYRPDRTALECAHLYDLGQDHHSSGMTVAAEAYPAYFRALEREDVIAADDACTDPRTSELTEGYLRPLGITAMLDAPVRVGGAVAGVVCHEHVGSNRRWTEDEQVFALAIANLASLALEGWERHRAENELQDAQQSLERAVSAGGVGLWDWDLRTNQVSYSREWKRQLGYEDHEISNGFTEWQNRLHPDDRDRAMRTVEAFLAKPTPTFALEKRLQHKNGKYRNILARGSLLRNDAGEPVRLLGSHVDITERAELQAQFLQAQKMEGVGQLAGGVAHDFNNLLTVINGTVELMLQDLGAEDALRADLQLIRDAGDRATSLTSQLLAFSRKQILRPAVLDLNAVLAGMQSMLRRLIGEDISLVIRPAAALGPVKADRSQIEQVIMNLAVNARDAMPDGGVLTLETNNVELDAAYASVHPCVTPGRYVRLAVSDAGAGMDRATRARIFEPFFTTKGPGRGTGLGLSTVYGIVKQSGGSIDVYSEPGQGTAFKIYLPEVDETADRPRPDRTPTTTRGTETILFVEDDAAVRDLASRMLRSAGYTVFPAGDAMQALAFLGDYDGPVHLVITDLIMPGMSGRDLAERLVVIRPTMKVIFSSGYTDDTILRRGMIEGSAHFVAKPYSVRELTRKVREVLEMPEARS